MDDIPCPIHLHAQKTPTHPALITPEKTLSYEELDHAIASIALPSHPFLLFPAYSTLTTLLLIFAILRHHHTACPINPKTPTPQKYLAAFTDATWIDSLQLQTPKQAPTLKPTSLATCLLTSGTTHTPKIACHTLQNHLSSAHLAIPHLSLSTHSRYLLTVPLFHVSGLAILFRAFTVGCTVVLSDLPLHDALNKHAITHASLVPTQLYRLLQTPCHLPHLENLLIGGAPLPSSLLTQARAAKLPIHTTYGMTEMSSMITYDGKPLIPVQLTPDGEILVSGSTLFAGYLQDKTLTPPPKWFPTRDLGRLNPEGTLTILGRKDRLFISGGENIQPEEIEQALLQIPGIERARIRAIEDVEFGQRPVAFIASTRPYTLEEIKTSLSSTLPSFKHPIQIHPMTEEMLATLK